MTSQSTKIVNQWAQQSLFTAIKNRDEIEQKKQHKLELNRKMRQYTKIISQKRTEEKTHVMTQMFQKMLDLINRKDFFYEVDHKVYPILDSSHKDKFVDFCYQNE